MNTILIFHCRSQEFELCHLMILSAFWLQDINIQAT